MNEITVFENSQFGNLEVVNIGNEPWFWAKDVANMLGYVNPRDAVYKHVDKEDKGVAKRDTLNGGSQDATIINESGLYSLIMSSKLPEARQFKRWVTHEVIPAIRSHGAYLTPELTEQVLSDPDTIIRLATDLKSERAARRAAEQQIAADAQKVLFADSVAQSSDEIPVGELANFLHQNGINIGRNRLFQRLREDGFIQKFSRLPTQKAMNLGLFRVIESVTNTPDGAHHLNYTTKVTGKGQLYFMNHYLSDCLAPGFIADLL